MPSTDREVIHIFCPYCEKPVEIEIKKEIMVLTPPNATCKNCHQPLRFVSAGADDEGESYWTHDSSGKRDCNLVATK